MWAARGATLDIMTDIFESVFHGKIFHVRRITPRFEIFLTIILIKLENLVVTGWHKEEVKLKRSRRSPKKKNDDEHRLNISKLFECFIKLQRHRIALTEAVPIEGSFIWVDEVARLLSNDRTYGPCMLSRSCVVLFSWCRWQPTLH